MDTAITHDTGREFPEVAPWMNRLFPPVGLGTIGAACLLVYGAMDLFFARYAFSAHRLLVEPFLWGAVISLVWLYLAGMRALQKPHHTDFRIIVLVGACSVLLAAAIPPFDAMDLFAYVNAGWLQAHYELNPYVSVVGDVPGWQTQPIFSAYYADTPFVYGFVFAWVCKWICRLGHGSLPFTIALFKAACLFAFGMAGCLVYASAKALKIPRPELSLHLFLWNPLLLLQFISNAHNDVFMTLFLVLALYLVIIDRWLWVFPALMVSVMIKLISIIVVPFVVVYCFKQKRHRTGLVGILIASVGLFLVSAPYLSEFQHFRFAEISAQLALTNGSLFQTLSESYILLIHLIPSIAPGLKSFQLLAQWTSIAAFAVVCAVCFYQAARAEKFSISDLISTCLMLAILLICVVSAKFFSWYLGILVPLALFLPQGHWLRVMTITLSCFHMLSFTALAHMHFLNFLIMTAIPIAWTIRTRFPPAKEATAHNP